MHEKILHICKNIVKLEQLLNESVDELLDAVGITREEARDD